MISDKEWKQSDTLVADARSLLPDAVSSPIRTYSEVASPQLVIKRGYGSHVWDVDENKYLDFMLGLGPIILGHADQRIAKAIRQQCERGSVFASSTEVEYDLAAVILRAIGYADQLRFVCSGTEATMTAVRLTRAFTSRQCIVKFSGAYHGHADSLMTGVHWADDDSKDAALLVCPYNDVDALEATFDKRGSEIAGVIVEPVACNVGVVEPTNEFMEAIRACCDRVGALVIFDEVVTGFRLCFGSAATRVGIVPDLVTLGKVIGGGLPIGAYGGRRDIMRLLEGRGGVFQGGTFAGNPMSMAAGLAALAVLDEPGFYEHLEELGATFERAFYRELPHSHQAKLYVERAGSIASVVARGSSAGIGPRAYRHLHQDLLKEGLLLAPSCEEPIFFCAAHAVTDAERLGSALAKHAATHCEAGGESA